jgi:Asp-tRNA(Asn)/Glu-tRNA(Gln) amidotransferase C subunit
VSRPGGDAVHDAVSLARLALGDAPAAARLVEECTRVADAWHGLPEQPDGAAGSAIPGPPGPTGLSDVLRDDEPAAGLTVTEALSGASDAADDVFRVARVADIADVT